MIRVGKVLVGVLLAVGLAGSAVAQMRTDGSKFLEAVKKRDGDTVMELLGVPGNTLVNARDLSNGQGILHIVVARHDLTWLRFFLQRGANPNLPDAKGGTALQLAAQLGFVEAVDALVVAGADVDVPDSTGETPLIAAVHRRDLATARILLAKNADPDRNDNSGRSARDYARLMAATTLLDAMTAADSARAAKQQSYGPN